jgi:hypothetical protein
MATTQEKQAMEKFLKIVVTLAAIAIIVVVRLHRALESALWEICPGAMTWTRNVIDAAHKAVCREQREAIESRRTSAPKPKKLKPAVKPVSELPSEFPSFDEQMATTARLRAEWDAAREARKAHTWGTPEYKAANVVAEERWEVLSKAYRIPVRY